MSHPKHSKSLEYLDSIAPHNISLLKKISDISKAGIRFLRSGMKVVTKEQYEERLQICEGCEHKTDEWKCNLCGCYLSVKAKLPLEDCPFKIEDKPASKWPKIELVVMQENGKCGGCGKA